MPWKETCVMDEKVHFISAWLRNAYTMSELCDGYGISRPTGYKWAERYKQSGLDGLKACSRRPHHHPMSVPEAIKEQIIEVKLSHQSWGPKKVLDYLRRREPGRRWPVDSTAGEILKRAGLVRRRRRRRRVCADSQPFAACDRSNRVWSADFKGQFHLGNGAWCYPLTITDNYSRYLFECRALASPTKAGVWPWFEWVFREYGLPEAIRSDNGVPFASLALGGISHLSKWWIKLGIKPERIKPGKPSQNGRHERMHRSLKAATALPPKGTMAAQQQAFDVFVPEYNEERSHEALERRTPAEVYQSSDRTYPAILKAIDYDSSYRVRSVRQNGEMRWNGQFVYVSEVLAKERIGLKQIDEHCWQVYFSFYLLGTFDRRVGKITPCQHWHGAIQGGNV